MGVHVERNYEFSQSLIYAIQGTTGEKTHEVMATLVSKADDLLKSHEIDIETPQLVGWSNDKNLRDYIFYPETKIHLGVYVHVAGRRDYSTRNKNRFRYTDTSDLNEVTYRFKLPTTTMKLNQKEYDDIALDGILMDESLDLEEPTIRKTKTPAEKRAAYEEKQAKIRAKREAKAAKNN
jgi:hypothetical protein